MEEIKKGENWRKGYTQGVKEERTRIRNIVTEWKDKGFEIDTLIDRLGILELEDKFEQEPICPNCGFSGEMSNDNKCWSSKCKGKKIK